MRRFLFRYFTASLLLICIYIPAQFYQQFPLQEVGFPIPTFQSVLLLSKPQVRIV